MSKNKSLKPNEERPCLPQEIKDLNGKSGQKVKVSIDKLIEKISGAKAEEKPKE